MNGAFDEAKQFISSNKIEMIDFKMIDLDGRWRHLTIPAVNFTESILEHGIGFDGSNYGYATVEKSDMVFIPDLDTMFIDPFTSIPTVSMIDNVMVIGKENRPFDQYPRNIAKSAESYMQKRGITDEMIIGPEFKFHVFDNVSYKVGSDGACYHLDTPEAEWNAGRASADNNGYQISQKGGYHIDVPKDITCDLRSKMCILLNRMGVPVKYHNREVGGSVQLEIEVELGRMSMMADHTMIVKYIVKNCAAAEGKTATFMPKPIYQEAGNGMHVHMLPRKEGKPLFYDENGYSGLSRMAHYFIGGLLRHVALLCALTNPSTNSYKRLIPGFEAPVTIGYATANRSAVIKIPAYAKSPDIKRFEIRNPDATCNQYFAYSALLMAGIDGIENRIDPADYNWGPFEFNLYNLSREDQKRIELLPRTLNEALDALEKDHHYLTRGGVFPEELLRHWIDRKRKEVNQVNNVPHPAEYKLYYDLSGQWTRGGRSRSASSPFLPESSAGGA